MSDIPSLPPEEVVAYCLDQILAGELTLEASVKQFPEAEAEVRSLLPLASLLREAGEVAPTPSYRQHGYSRLEARLAESSRPPRLVSTPPAFIDPAGALSSLVERLRLFLLPRPRYATAFVAILLLLVAGSVLGVTAVDAAAPGDRLYAADLALEQARLRLARSQRAQTELLIRFAGERLAEAQGLADRSDDEHLQAAMLAYAAQAEQITATIANGEHETGTAEPVSEAMSAQETALNTLYQTSAGDPALFCQDSGARHHPLIAALAARYDQPYALVRAQLCGGEGFGQLVLALVTAEQSGLSLEELLALRSDGNGWGQVWQELGATVVPIPGPGGAKPPLETEPAGGEEPPAEIGTPDPPARPEAPGRPDDPGAQGREHRPDHDRPGRPEDPGTRDDNGRPDDPGSQGRDNQPENGRPEDSGDQGGGGRPDNPGNQDRENHSRPRGFENRSGPDG